MLHKEIPFLRIGLPFCTGIISGLTFHPGRSLALVLISASLLIFILSLFFNKRLNNYPFGIFISTIMVLSGNLLYNAEMESLSTLEDKESVYVCRVSEYPEEKENTYSMSVKLIGIFRDTITQPIHLKGNILLYHDKRDSVNIFLPGDIIIIKCSPLEVVNRGNPGEFDYKSYLENRGTRYYSYTKATDILYKEVPRRRPLRYSALIIREKIIEMLRQRGLDGDKLALVAAVTLGNKNLLDPETKMHFSKAGAMHIMAVSGLNAGILGLFIFNLLFFLNGKLTHLKSIITIIVIWGFAFITGFSPSVARAALMFTFIHAGKMLRREPHPVNSVLASAFVMLLIKPSDIFDAGFQLSYLAVIFIICFYEKLESKVTFKNRIPEWIWQAFCVTIIAQAGTLAVTIMYFNTFPVYFLLTNLIVVPVSSLMIIIAFLLIITFPVTFISQMLGDLLSITSVLTGESARLISSLRFSSIDNIGLTMAECILLTLFIFLLLNRIFQKESYSIHLPVIFLLLLILTGTYRNIRTKKTNELIVYNTGRSTTIGIRTGKSLNIYNNDSIIPAEVFKHSAVERLKINPLKLPYNSFSLTVNDFKILITNNINVNTSANKNHDIVILTGRFPKITSKDIGVINPQIIIVSPEAFSKNVLTGGDNSAGALLYFVRDSGGISIPF